MNASTIFVNGMVDFVNTICYTMLVTFGGTMYNELIKIIEGGVVCDSKKVVNYSLQLASSLEKSGEEKLAQRIKDAIKRRPQSVAMLDSFMTRPVDSETRLDIVDVTYPSITEDRLVFSRYVHDAISQFVEEFKRIDQLIQSGIVPANTLLLYGPPGCGKSSAAKLIASMLQLPLVTAQLDCLVSSLLGSTAKNIRKVFEYAGQQPCVLFLDEFDVIAKMRDDKNELGELKRVVNSLLQNIDQFGPSSVLIAATNHDQLLDPAVWRRFATTLRIDIPDADGVESILKLNLSGVKNDIICDGKVSAMVCEVFSKMSPSDMECIISSVRRKVALSGRESISEADIIGGAYLFQNHAATDDGAFASYLIDHKISIRDINETFGIPLRKVKAISRAKA